MYQEFKQQLIDNMAMRRDMIVLRASESSLEPLFDVATSDDKLYKRIIDEFNRLAIQHVENLLYDLCVKYEIPAEKNANTHRFDLEIELEGVTSYIDLRTSPTAFNSSSILRLGEAIKEVESPVYLVYLVKDNQQSRRALSRQMSRMYEYQDFNNLEILLFEEFLLRLFGKDELVKFQKAMLTYKDEMHQAIGYQITEIFNDRNLTLLKEDLDTEFRVFDYDRIKIDRFEEVRAEKPYFRDLNNSNFNKIKEKFIGNNRYKLLLGNSDFARSFLTSEWLFKKYFSMEEMDNTFIVAGYLKSVEQLLWDIIYLIGQGRQIRDTIIREDNSDDIDSSLGSLQFFITNYLNDDLFETVFGKSTHFVMSYLSMQLSSWRSRYRNGYFHKDNLTDRQKIDDIRDETFFLYLLILGSIALNDEEINSLGI